MADIERRVYPAEVRADGDGPMISGYSAMFGKESQDLGGFIEKIARGAFAKTIRENPNIMALFNHNANNVLGRTGNGTLRLEENRVGLRMEVDLPDTQTAKEVRELIARGDITGQSFAFETLRDSWEYPDGDKPIRTLQEVRLFDVGPVTFPAYQDTKVSARALDMINGTPHSEEPPEQHPDEPQEPEATEPPDQHSEEEPVTVRPRSILVKEWRIAVESGK